MKKLVIVFIVVSISFKSFTQPSQRYADSLALLAYHQVSFDSNLGHFNFFHVCIAYKLDVDSVSKILSKEYTRKKKKVTATITETVLTKKAGSKLIDLGRISISYTSLEKGYLYQWYEEASERQFLAINNLVQYMGYQLISTDGGLYFYENHETKTVFMITFDEKIGSYNCMMCNTSK